MDSNSSSSSEEDPDSSEMQRKPVSFRKPRNLQGLLKIAIEATEETAPPQNVEMDEERRQFLADALQHLTMDIGFVIRQSIPILTDANKIRSHANRQEVEEDVRAAFETTISVVEDLDNANDYCKSGGFDAFPLCYNTPNPKLWGYANDLLAGVSQNFPTGQALALDYGLLSKLLELLREPDTKMKDKFVRALSCCVREYPPGCKVLISEGGCETLADVLSTSDDHRLTTKAACLLKYLLQHYPEETKDRILTLDLPEIVVYQINQNIGRTTEFLLGLLCTCIKSSPKVLAQCIKPDLGLQKLLKSVLSNPIIADDPEKNEEAIEYAKEILVVFEQEHPACEEEVDR